jgi:hypothetical protein
MRVSRLFLSFLTRDKHPGLIELEQPAAKTMDQDYKGHHIQSVPRQLPDSGRWTAHVVINWTAGSREELRQFEVKRGFATQEEAEMGGLIFARKWIDGGRPPLRDRGTGSS